MKLSIHQVTLIALLVAMATVGRPRPERSAVYMYHSLLHVVSGVSRWHLGWGFRCPRIKHHARVIAHYTCSNYQLCRNYLSSLVSQSATPMAINLALAHTHRNCGRFYVRISHNGHSSPHSIRPFIMGCLANLLSGRLAI